MRAWVAAVLPLKADRAHLHHLAQPIWERFDPLLQPRVRSVDRSVGGKDRVPAQRSRPEIGAVVGVRPDTARYLQLEGGWGTRSDADIAATLKRHDHRRIVEFTKQVTV